MNTYVINYYRDGESGEVSVTASSLIEMLPVLWSEYHILEDEITKIIIN